MSTPVVIQVKKTAPQHNSKEILKRTDSSSFSLSTWHFGLLSLPLPVESHVLASLVCLPEGQRKKLLHRRFDLSERHSFAILAASDATFQTCFGALLSSSSMPSFFSPCSNYKEDVLRFPVPFHEACILRPTRAIWHRTPREYALCVFTNVTCYLHAGVQRTRTTLLAKGYPFLVSTNALGYTPPSRLHRFDTGSLPAP